ncbi:Type I site-specific deoxyribonuclease, HsdR family, partial [human gut metagenome]
AQDGQYLDIVIVVDQLLTGFDAPQLNTLYVDRTLKDAMLIQAYSRTNRIADNQGKPWGRIVNYRWPA